MHEEEGEAPTRAPAAYETQPSQVGTVNVTPALESSGPAVDIKPKELGDWLHETPRHETGYIEEVGQDDIFGDDVWARQIKSALPVISYDVFPEPRDVINPIVEEPHVEAPEIPVIVERVAPRIIERAAPVIIEERAPVIFEEMIIPSAPLVPPHMWAAPEPIVIERSSSPWKNDKKN